MPEDRALPLGFDTGNLALAFYHWYFTTGILPLVFNHWHFATGILPLA